MSQIVGIQVPVAPTDPNKQGQNWLPASVLPTDSQDNGGLLVVTPADMNTQRTDSSDPDVLYIGDASPGSDPNEPVWRIKRILQVPLTQPVGSSSSSSAATETLTSFAMTTAGKYIGQAGRYDQVWANRTLLTYG